MLLTAKEQEQLTGVLWSTAEHWREAFGCHSRTAHLLERVMRALDRGEVVQRRGGWVREGNGVFRREKP